MSRDFPGLPDAPKACAAATRIAPAQAGMRRTDRWMAV